MPSFNLNNVGFLSVAAMTNVWGRDLSHFGQQVQTEGIADGKASIGNIFTEKVVDGKEVFTVPHIVWSDMTGQQCLQNPIFFG